MKIQYVILLAVITVGGAQAFAYTEDFEDDSHGGNPTETWYSYSENNDATVIDGIGVDGGKALRIQTSSVTESLSLFDTDGLIDLCDTANYAFEYDFQTAQTASIANAFGRSMILQSDTLTGNDQGFGVNHNPTSAAGDAFANGGGGVDFGDSIPMTTGTWYHIEIIPDCANSNVAVYLDGNGPYNADATGSYGGVLDNFRLSAGKVDVGTHTLYYDNIEITAPEPPAASPGVEGSVTDAVNAPETFQLYWLLSPDDTDPVNAAYTYELYYDDGSPTLAFTGNPGNAVNGVMGTTVNAAITGAADWYVIAINGTLESDSSCIITLDADTQGDTDSCGTPIPGSETTGSTSLTGEDGILFGGDRAGLADSLQISEGSLNFLIGLMLTMLITAGGWFSYRFVGAAAGGLVGVITSYAIGLYPFWVIYVLAFILIAGTILYVKTKGGMNG